MTRRTNYRAMPNYLPPYEACGCFFPMETYGDGFPPHLSLKSLNLSLKLILCGLILLTLSLLCLRPPLRVTF